jgi:ribosomal protein S19E (S16A)
VAIIALCVIVMAVRKKSRKKFARPIETYTFGQDWEELCGTQKYDFHNYVSVDRDVATSGISTVEELCEAYGSTRSVEDRNKEDENVQDVVPNFAET